MILKDVTLSYGKKVVASGINAELSAGELVCLVGRNGSGKSTLIRHILRLGNGVEAGTADGRHDVARLISVVLTDRIDVENMTVADVVALGRTPYTGFFGLLSDKDRAIVSEAMAMTGITEFAKRMVSTLSDGERQKAVIAKALAQQTPIILLDEPTAFLDHPSKVETMTLLRRLCREQHKAVLISTHDLEVSVPYCDRVWLMKDGRMETMTPEKFSFDKLANLRP